jgi:hypothetical protein
MPEAREHILSGTRGRIAVREWPAARPRYVALLAHGYGEHIGRYEEVAGVLTRHARRCTGPITSGTAARPASGC